MYCPVCGLTMDDRLKFCTNCGSPLHQNNAYEPPMAGMPNGDSRAPYPAGSGSPTPNIPSGTSDRFLASVLVNKKSEGWAILLSMMIAGLGHIYLGIRKGVLFAILYIICLVVGVPLASMFLPLALLDMSMLIYGACGLAMVIIGIAILIYCLYDALRKTRSYNQYLLQNGQPPW